MERSTVCLIAASLAVATTAFRLLTLRNSNHVERPEDKNTISDKNDSSPVQDERPAYGNLPLDLAPHLQRELYKQQRRKEKIPFLAMKSPMYDNIRMVDPEGQALSTISIKKARWYVSKQIAEWKTPSSIQLLFEPSGRSSNDTYTSSPKCNICVACGASGHVMRHYIVPYAYRSLLPKKYKSHQSHDIVILCPKCHLYCEQSYHEHREQLEDSLRADPSTAIVDIVDPHKQRVRSAGLALLRWKERLPDAKIDEYEKLVQNHLGVTSSHPLSDEQLQQAIDVEYRVPNPTYVSGSKLVADHLMKSGHDAITRFVEEWRAFFLETVQPRHLPTGWRVNAPVACSEHKT
jgi:exonuclease 3'-5' domain-containing protein 2